jgi:hypothetical protein
VARSALSNGRSLSTLYVNAEGQSSHRVIRPDTSFVRGDGSNNGPDFTVNVANDVLLALDAFVAGPYPFLPGKPCTLDLSSGE